MIAIKFTTEEVVTRETIVLVADDDPRPEDTAEHKLWDGNYASSKEVERRDERILKTERIA